MRRRRHASGESCYWVGGDLRGAGVSGRVRLWTPGSWAVTLSVHVRLLVPGVPVTAVLE